MDRSTGRDILLAYYVKPRLKVVEEIYPGTYLANGKLTNLTILGFFGMSGLFGFFKRQMSLLSPFLRQMCPLCLFFKADVLFFKGGVSSQPKCLATLKEFLKNKYLK